MENKAVCSFCGKDSDKVRCMIAGPSDNVFICDECVEICHEIVSDRVKEEEEEKRINSLDISEEEKDFLRKYNKLDDEDKKIILDMAENMEKEE